MKSSTSRPSIAEVLGHRQARQADAQARARRLVHLAEDHHRLVDHAGLGHLVVEVVALAGALAHAGEDRVAAVLRGDVADQLLDDDRLADARAAEDADLAAPVNGAIRSMTLMPVSKTSPAVRLLVEARGGAVDRRSAARRPTGPLSSIGSPSTLKMRPSVSGPTGTVIGAPVSHASMPRRRPSVVAMATARTHVVAEVLLRLQRQRRAVAA